MRMPQNTKQKMEVYAQTLPASTNRAQCYTIANYELCEETIADRIKRDHCNQDGHLRAASLMVNAGCAKVKAGKKHCYGTFIFEDGSSF